MTNDQLNFNRQLRKRQNWVKTLTNHLESVSGASGKCSCRVLGGKSIGAVTGAAQWRETTE